MTTNDNQLAPFNQIQGIAHPNIPAYSNESDDFISFECAYVHGIYTGLKWQCVEFARRWLLLQCSCTFPSVADAAEMWLEITHVERVTDGQHLPVKKHPNGSSTKPKCGAFLLYPRGEEIPFGHIAVICQVGENFIRVVEQNYQFRYWRGDFSREIPMIYRDGGYFLEDYYQIYGWMDIINQHELTPLDLSNLDNVLEKYRSVKPIGKIERSFVSNPDDSMESNDEDSLVYCRANEDFLLNLSATSNEIYRLLMLATDRVIQRDDILTDFGIPEAFWLSLRRSWSDESLPDLISHLDFKFNGMSLKLTDYRSDNVSMLTECAVLQDTWAERFNLKYDFSSSFQLHRLLVRKWKQMHLQTDVHILIENEREEMITALYMQKILKEAEIQSKVCLVPDDLMWQNGLIFDKDGDELKFVWGLWKWEKVFQDYLDQNEFEWGFGQGVGPQLTDILFNEDIQVIEPRWKSITNHRTMLTILNRMFVDHSNLFDKDDDEFRSIPSRDWTINVVSWMIRGLFSGFGLREDQQEKSRAICCVI